MSNLQEVLDSLPSAKGIVSIISGGMDSTIALRLAVEKYGPENILALSFDYGQKQKYELQLAAKSCAALIVRHKIVPLEFLKEASMGFSANVDPSMQVPSLEEVLGDPAPSTYIPYRNFNMLGIAASFAEQAGYDRVLCGLQVHDLYHYWDTTKPFIDLINQTFALNRKNRVQVMAPFAGLSKTDELRLLLELDGNADLLKNTLTCYDPNENNESCSQCASCRERLNAFAELGIEDPIPYIKG